MSTANCLEPIYENLKCVFSENESLFTFQNRAFSIFVCV